MKRYMLWTLLGTMAVAPAMAQGDADFDARLAAARELFSAQQRDKITDALIKNHAETYANRLAQLHPELPKNRITELRAKIEINLSKTKSDYLAQEESVVARQINLQDLRAAISFYKSPVGQRLASATVVLIPASAKNQAIWVSSAVTRATNDMNASAKVPK